MNEEHKFSLPTGYVDVHGAVHRRGVMRLATFRDETVVCRDPRVEDRASYQAILVLARVVTQLGELDSERVTPEIIESLPAADLAVLQDLYRQINYEPAFLTRFAAAHTRVSPSQRSPATSLRTRSRNLVRNAGKGGELPRA